MSLTLSRKRNFSLIDIHKKALGQLLTSEERENRYSHSVLIGNWFEERFANRIDHKAITPGLYGQTSCPLQESHYKADFKQKISLNDSENFEEFINWKQQGFSNRLNSECTNIKLWDGEQFAKNLTSFKDLMFRIQPEKFKSKEAEFSLLKRQKINDDYMRSFGNSTRTGLRFWRECEKRKEDAFPLDVSHYRNNFKSIQMPHKRVLCKGEQRKTSIL